MNNKKHSPEEFDPCTFWEQDTYQTGSTRPPKSHGSLIAVLLVLVIFLCGISTGLGLMNIRLFRQLNAASEQENAPVAFSQTTEETASTLSKKLGFSTENIPEFWRLYQDVPQGIYITDVEENSDAAVKGIVPGDILLQVDGVSVTDTADLNELMRNRRDHTTVQLLICRTGEHLTVTLVLMQD